MVAEPVEATTIGSGALPDDTTVKAAMGGEPIGRSVSASLSSRGGRYIVIALCLLWTIPTFGLLVSSVRPRGGGQDVGVVGGLHPAQVHAEQLRRRALVVAG